MGCVVSNEVSGSHIRRVQVASAAGKGESYKKDNVSYVDCDVCGGQGLFCLTGVPHDKSQVLRPDSSDERRADRMYLMGVYDSRTLLFDLLCYIQHGTTLKVLHSSTTMLFWLEPNSSTISLIDINKAVLKCGTHSHGKPMETSASSVLSHIQGITLGAYTGKRACESANLLVFTLIFDNSAKGDTVFKGELMLCARTTQELEAWVITLACLTGIAPTWATALDVSCCPGYESLDEVERAACHSHNIPPQLYLRVSSFVQDKVDEVKQCKKRSEAKAVMCGVRTPMLRQQGALRLSKGELRYWTGVDIFRTSIVWTLLERKGVLYDEQFRFATPPVPLYTLWFWSHANHAKGSSSLKIVIKTVLFCLHRKDYLALPEELLTIVFTFLPMFP